MNEMEKLTSFFYVAVAAAKISDSWRDIVGKIKV